MTAPDPVALTRGHDLERAVMAALGSLPGVVVHRNPKGKTRLPSGATVSLGIAGDGAPDLMVEVLWPVHEDPFVPGVWVTADALACALATGRVEVMAREESLPLLRRLEVGPFVDEWVLSTPTNSASSPTCRAPSARPFPMAPPAAPSSGRCRAAPARVPALSKASSSRPSAGITGAARGTP